jgi:hypothetical protein
VIGFVAFGVDDNDLVFLIRPECDPKWHRADDGRKTGRSLIDRRKRSRRVPGRKI